MEDYLVYTKWFRIYWTDIFAVGFGLDFDLMIIGLYLGPITIFIGYNNSE
jgi:hypothetical protein